MSDEEHLIENLIAYVQSVGWAYVPNRGTERYESIYGVLSKNGTHSVSEETFWWLLQMAVYVVYRVTVCNTDFSDEETEDERNQNRS
jgi:hypothetical protein